MRGAGSPVAINIPSFTVTRKIADNPSKNKSGLERGGSLPPLHIMIIKISWITGNFNELTLLHLFCINL